MVGAAFWEEGEGQEVEGGERFFLHRTREMHQTINYKITLLFACNKTSKGKKFIPLPATHLASGNESQRFSPNFFVTAL